MLRITKESEYAFLLLNALLRKQGTAQSAVSLAETTGIAVPMTGKVLKRLVKANILESVRGAYGGYQLTRSPQEISALWVVEAMEGKPELVDCVSGQLLCALAERCQISPFWQQIDKEIKLMLASRNLADMQALDNHQ